MGHVSPGSVPQAGDGAELPGREHRGVGAGRPALSRTETGILGEDLVADRYLVWGHEVVGRNLRAAGAECDLLVAGPSGRVVVEVKTVTDGDPFLHVDEAKERSLRRLARALGAVRVDVVGVVLGPDGARVHAVHGW